MTALTSQSRCRRAPSCLAARRSARARSVRTDTTERTSMKKYPKGGAEVPAPRSAPLERLTRKQYDPSTGSLARRVGEAAALGGARPACSRAATARRGQHHQGAHRACQPHLPGSGLPAPTERENRREQPVWTVAGFDESQWQAEAAFKVIKVFQDAVNSAEYHLRFPRLEPARSIVRSKREVLYDIATRPSPFGRA